MAEQKSDETVPELLDAGDRWTFVAVLPSSSYVHTVHSGPRNQEEAQVFTAQIKKHSDGVAPLFESDGWFYAQVLSDVYSTQEAVPYKGRGRKPHPKRVVDPNLKYVQLVKHREGGKVVKTSTRIVLGDELAILDLLDATDSTISTAYVESRNGAFRKDNKRQTRKTKCHSKQIGSHDAHVQFLKGVYNLTKENERFRILINPEAKRFETKYEKVSPAMKQGLVSKIYPLEQVLMMRPLMLNIN
jgi:hypothetical protein